MSNNRIDTELAGKRALADFRVAFTHSADENEKRSAELYAQIASGDVGEHDVEALAREARKCATASKYQRKALVDMADSEVKALMRFFKVGDAALACINSYSLQKLRSLGAMLAANDWQAQSEPQLAVWLARVIDEDNEIDYSAWKAQFNGGEQARHGLASVKRETIANSPTQRNQSDCLAERLGMVERTRDGAHFATMEKREHKVWQAIEQLFDANLAALASTSES